MSSSPPPPSGVAKMINQKREARRLSSMPNQVPLDLNRLKSVSSGGYGSVSIVDDAETGGVGAGERSGGSRGSTGDMAKLWEMLTTKKINVLLLFMPLGYVSHAYKWSDQSIFWLNFLAMIPLASILGDFTEELALHTNQVIGGLINATFGNAVEMVVAVQGMMAGQIRVVQASMLGSVFSNLLLVLGCCFFFGGILHKEQTFNAVSASSNMGLLTLSSLALVLPTPFAQYYDVGNAEVLMISRIAALFLLAMYLQLLFFQLYTHSYLVEDDDDDDEEEPELSFATAMIGLLIVTLLVALFSEWLVSSIDGFTESSGISKTFVGLIILPVVGNAVEHITAVTVAMKDKMDLSIGVAVGSSAQISLFVVPFIIIYGYFADINMTLNFPPFEIMLYVLSVVIVTGCVSNGRSNWLEGSLLITTYVMIGVGFWFEKVKSF